MGLATVILLTTVCMNGCKPAAGPSRFFETMEACIAAARRDQLDAERYYWKRLHVIYLHECKAIDGTSVKITHS